MAFDARGNPVWEWRTVDGQFQKDASTTLIASLEASELSLETTAIVKAQGSADAKKAGLPCGGFNPYDSGGVAAPAAPAAPAVKAAPVARRPAPQRPVAQSAASPERKAPGLLQRLQSWVDGKGPAKR